MEEGADGGAVGEDDAVEVEGEGGADAIVGDLVEGAVAELSAGAAGDVVETVEFAEGVDGEGDGAFGGVAEGGVADDGACVGAEFGEGGGGAVGVAASDDDLGAGGDDGAGGGEAEAGGAADDGDDFACEHGARVAGDGCQGKAGAENWLACHAAPAAPAHSPRVAGTRGTARPVGRHSTLAMALARGSKRTGPATAMPPPMTTRSGSTTLMTEAMPQARAWRDRSQTAMASGFPAETASTRARVDCQRPAEREATL